MYDEFIFLTEEACNLFVRIIQVSKTLKSKPLWMKKSLKYLISDKNSLRYKNI